LLIREPQKAPAQNLSGVAFIFGKFFSLLGEFNKGRDDRIRNPNNQHARAEKEKKTALGQRVSKNGVSGSGFRSHRQRNRAGF